MAVHPVTRERLTHDLTLESLTGIEIGPLVRPIVTRDKSDVRYVDRASTEELQKWYSKDPEINVDDIMTIDYVWGEQSLAEATGAKEAFDYCIASHVIEHIPDLITWLQEIDSILKPGAIASFAVPDRRYTFDFLRSETTIADLVEAHIEKRRKPSLKQIYDHFANHTNVDITAAWQPGYDGAELIPNKAPQQVFDVCEDAHKTGKYVDSHCSVFTEMSFFNLLNGISELGLLNFRIKNAFPVPAGMLEFYVQLEKIDSSLTTEEKHSLYRQSFDAVKQAFIKTPEEPDNRSSFRKFISLNKFRLKRLVGLA